MKKSEIITRLKEEFDYTDSEAETVFSKFFPWAFKNKRTMDQLIQEIKDSAPFPNYSRLDCGKKCGNIFSAEMEYQGTGGRFDNVKKRPKYGEKNETTN